MASDEDVLQPNRGADDSELATSVSSLLAEFKVLRKDVQALKQAQSGTAYSSSGATVVPTNGIERPSHIQWQRGERTRLEESSSEDDAGAISGDDAEESGLVELSEATGAFVEAAFKKMDNTQRKKKLDKYGTPDSFWL